MPKLIDITGERFGKLTVRFRAENHETPNGSKQTRWLCICDCGSYTNSRSSDLRNGKSLSCGCTRVEYMQILGSKGTHLATNTPEYTTWGSMKQRCYNLKHKSYKDYGGRGISICEEWLTDFPTFLVDMGKRPEGTSIDRIDVNGNYEPSNCRWATASVQQLNKRIKV